MVERGSLGREVGGWNIVTATKCRYYSVHVSPCYSSMSQACSLIRWPLAGYDLISLRRPDAWFNCTSAEERRGRGEVWDKQSRARAVMQVAILSIKCCGHNFPMGDSWMVTSPHPVLLHLPLPLPQGWGRVSAVNLAHPLFPSSSGSPGRVRLVSTGMDEIRLPESRGDPLLSESLLRIPGFWLALVSQCYTPPQCV